MPFSRSEDQVAVITIHRQGQVGFIISVQEFNTKVIIHFCSRFFARFDDIGCFCHIGHCVLKLFLISYNSDQKCYRQRYVLYYMLLHIILYNIIYNTMCNYI